MILRIAGIVDDSVVDGPGVRYTIFTQGCSHNCRGCHNPATHDYNAGTPVEPGEIIADLRQFKYLDAVTLSGGEPLDQPEAVLELVTRLKDFNYNVLIFSGYTFDEIMNDPAKAAIMQFADTLVDGRFDVSRQSYDLNYRGSENQRIIDVPASLSQKKVCLREDLMEPPASPFRQS